MSRINWDVIHNHEVYNDLEKQVLGNMVKLSKNPELAVGDEKTGYEMTPIGYDVFNSIGEYAGVCSELAYDQGYDKGRNTAVKTCIGVGLVCLTVWTQRDKIKNGLRYVKHKFSKR